MRTLSRSHPLTAFCYVAAVMLITVFGRNPVVLAESFVGAALFSAFSGKPRGIGCMLVMTLLIAALNPLFSRGGATVLFFVGDKAVTLEAIAYGAAFGAALSAAALWGSAGTTFMTSDKYIWLFGRLLPSAGMVLSCTLRFIPLFVSRTAAFGAARTDERSHTVRGYLSAFCSAVGYSAEEAMSSADSMKARGYGSGRRTFYSRYRFHTADGAMLAFVLLCGGGSALLMLSGAGRFSFYPVMSGLIPDIPAILLYLMFGLLCAAPTVIVCAEAIRVRSFCGKPPRGENSRKKQ